LRFGKYISFDNAPFLHDEAWNPPEEKKKKKKKKKFEEPETEQTEDNLTQANLFDL
jgi:hypothetical protein